MNIYLKWNSLFISKNKEFSIFDLEIFQEENNFATARLVVKAVASLPPPGTEGILYEENGETFFKGLLIGAPTKTENDFAEIELIAKPIDFFEKSIPLQKEKRTPPFWDALWVKQEHLTDFQEIQSIQTASLYCNPRTGELSWSDWFEGKQTLQVGQKFFWESLSTKIVREPLAACTIKVHAYWIQSDSGVSNLGPALARAFPLGKVSTYTKNSLLSKWPAAGKKVGRSGIWVLKSDLKQVIPTSSLYPRFSPPLILASQGDVPKPHRAERYWFKPKLWVGWQVHQRRRETLVVTLRHTCQKLFPGKGEDKTLEFTLQNINPDPEAYRWKPNVHYQKGTKICSKNSIYKCNTTHTSSMSFEEDQGSWSFKNIFHTPLGSPARASFFLTERGYIAAEHAMERAKAELAKSARAFEIFFEGPWNILKEITTDMSVALTDPRLPGGKVKGKVTKYALIVKGETGERFVRVTLLCTVDHEKVETEFLTTLPTYVDEGYGVETYQIHQNTLQKTPTGVTYYRYDEAVPIAMQQTGPLLKRIELTNNPDEQMEGAHLHQTLSGLKKALSQKPTRLKLFFKDLRTKEQLEHTIRVSSEWSAPLGVILTNK